MWSPLLLALIGCYAAAVPLGQSIYQTPVREQDYPSTYSGLSKYGYQKQPFAFNPWLARKYQNQLNQDYIPSSVGSGEYYQQLQYIQQQLYQIQQQLEEVKQFYQKSYQQEFQQTQWQQYWQTVQDYFQQYQELQGVYQQYSQQSQDVPVTWQSKLNYLQQQIYTIYQQIQSTYYYYYQSQGYQQQYNYPGSQYPGQQQTYTSYQQQQQPLYQKYQYQYNQQGQSPKYQNFGSYQQPKSWGFQYNSPYKTVQKSFQLQPSYQQRFSKNYYPQTFSQVSGKQFLGPYNYNYYQPQTQYPSGQSVWQSTFKRQRQQQVGVLPNQWDEDYTEQGTFQDLIRHYTRPAQNQQLQSQRQYAQIASQNVQIDSQSAQVVIEDAEYLKRQQQILNFLDNIYQSTIDPEIVQIGESYSFVENIQNYNDARAVQNLVKQIQKGLLPKEAVFSVFNPEHLKQVVTLFKVFYNAKDWETFVNTAAWAKVNVNEDLFQYVFAVAFTQRGDTDFLALPPSYVISPYYFINKYVIQKAQNLKQLVPNFSTEKSYVINSNYSGWYLNLDPEQYLSYFLEDVGLNDFYYYYHINYPFWLNSEYLKFGGERRGEQTYYLVQQLLARYYMERLSNNYGEIPEIDLSEQSVETGYVPSLRYPNGLDFPSRPSNAPLGRNEYVDDVQLIVERIRDAIDLGYVVDEQGNHIQLSGEDGFETLLNVIESTPESPNPQFYGPLTVIIRWVLGNSLEPSQPYNIVPSALEQFQTTLRDPVAWQAFKKFVELVQQYKLHLPTYNQQQLVFPGVTVERVQVDPLVTYFDQYDVDISNAVYVNEQESSQDSVKILARQARLNNKPFTVKFNVNSQQAQPAVVRIFLGPKYDQYGREIDIQKNRLNFFELDKFQVQLQQGVNNIVRESLEMNVAEDWSFQQDFSQQISQALQQQGSVKIQYSDLLTAFPRRLLLPKGQHGGQTFQLFVIVSPLIESPVQNQAIEQMQQNAFGQDYFVQKGILNQYVDALPLGYPFDREIDETVFFNIPNAVFQDVEIEHQGPEIFEAQLQIQGEQGYQPYQQYPSSQQYKPLF